MIDTADNNETGRGKGSDNKINLSNLSMSKKSIGASYLTFENTKRGGSNIKKSIKAARNSNYLNPDTKKTFNFLQHAFTQAFAFKHFDPKWQIWIKTYVSSYAISGVLS